MSKMEALRSEFIADLALYIEEMLAAAGIDSDTASTQALASADAFAERWQGLHLYVPKNIKKTSKENRKQIRAEFTGHNHGELAVKHKKHVRTIYKVLKQEKNYERK